MLVFIQLFMLHICLSYSYHRSKSRILVLVNVVCISLVHIKRSSYIPSHRTTKSNPEHVGCKIHFCHFEFLLQQVKEKYHDVHVLNIAASAV